MAADSAARAVEFRAAADFENAKKATLADTRSQKNQPPTIRRRGTTYRGVQYIRHGARVHVQTSHVCMHVRAARYGNVSYRAVRPRAEATVPCGSAQAVPQSILQISVCCRQATVDARRAALEEARAAREKIQVGTCARHRHTCASGHVHEYVGMPVTTNMPPSRDTRADVRKYVRMSVRV